MSPMCMNLKIGLKGYQALQTFQVTPPGIHVELSAKLTPKSCPHCQSSRLLSKGRYLRRVRHLDSFQKPTQLIVHTYRFFCRECRRSFVPKLPGIRPGRHSTEPFRKAIYQLHHDGICTRILARKHKLGEATVARIYQQFTRRKASERLSLECPRYLGIDEHTLHKSQRFCTTFCDLKNRRVFDIQPGRSSDDLTVFLRKLKGRERVRIVCIDLSSTYHRLIKRYFPNARIVADRFHVVRVIQHHFLQLARHLSAPLKSHRGNLAAFRKTPEKLTDVQRRRLHQLFASQPILETIYQQMHQLRHLMNQKHQTKNQCRKLIPELLERIETLRQNQVKPMQTLANTLQHWIEPIACMWRTTRNNGITEGFHRKMKLIQRRAYGFRNFENYRLRVIAQCG